MSNLWKAMLDAQKEIKHAVKDSKNPHFKNDYASLSAVLDAVKPTLNKHGLVLTQEIRHGNNEPGSVRVTTRIVHAASGEQTQDAQVIPLVKVDPQGHGSAVTYARRYAIQAMLGIASEDDDGNDASVKPLGSPRPPPPHVPNTVTAQAMKEAVKMEPTKADPARAAAVEKSLVSVLGFKKTHG